jgi:hypothetical protein
MNDVRRVLDLRTTDVFRTMKPGLATIFFAVGLMPTVVCAATAKE